MVVRLRLAGAFVGVGEDAEAELRVLVEQAAGAGVGTESGGYGLGVFEQVFERGDDLLASRGTGLGLEQAMTLGRELIDFVSHNAPPMAPCGREPWEPENPGTWSRAQQPLHLTASASLLVLGGSASGGFARAIGMAAQPRETRTKRQSVRLTVRRGLGA